MKKLLALLLIAIVACSSVSTVEEEEVSLQKLPDWIKKGWSKVKKVIKKVVTFLKETGLWDPIVKLLKTKGVEVARDLCLKAYDDEKFCDELIDNLLPKIDENGEVQLKFIFSFWATIFGYGNNNGNNIA